MGQPVNLAARLQASAAPGTTLIGETTYRLNQQQFEFESLDPLSLKGFDSPVNAYQLIEPSDRTGAGRGIPGLTTPLIGRKRELEALTTLVEELQTGRGAIAALVGEPGIGKSRLLADVHEASRDQPVVWAEGRAASHTTDQPFSLIRSLLSELMGINPHDTPAIIDLKIERELTPLFDRDLGDIWPAIALLLGAPLPPAYADRLEGLEPDALKRGMTNAFCQLVEAKAAKQALVLAFDDLHWADPSSIDLLQTLLIATERVPLLIALLFRPDRESRVWDLKAYTERDFGHRYHEIALQSLSEEESRELIETILSDRNLPQDLLQMLREKSEGNPFFLEELIQDLIETGALVKQEDGWLLAHQAQKVRIPDTLQEVIQARIDRLQEQERTTLQTAAVIGRRFGYRLLELISPENGNLSTCLLNLQRADFIRERGRLPEQVFDFKQAIVQEVAYHQLLSDQRTLLHAQVATTLSSSFSDRLDEHAAIIAHHYALAGNPQQAAVFHTRAGDEAFRVNANQEAAGHYRRAIDLGVEAGLPLSELSHAYLSYGRALELITQYQQALEVYQALQRRAEQEEDHNLALLARIAQTTLRVTPTPLFNPVDGLQSALDALELARELNDPVAQAKILWNLCLLGRFNGQDADALAYGEQSLAIAREHGLKEQEAFTLTDMYWSQLMEENLTTARTTIEQAHSIWQELGNLPMMADCLSGSAFLHYLDSDFEQANKTSQAAWDLSEKIDNLWGKSYSKLYIGNAFYELGQVQQAIEVMRKSVELGQQSGFVVPRAVLPAIIAFIHAELGAFDQAYDLISKAAPKQLTDLTGPFIRQMEAEIYLLAGELEKARVRIAEASAEPHIIGTLALLLPLEVTQASYALARKDYAKALEHLDGLIPLTMQRRISVLLPRMYLLRTLALEGLGREAEAAEQLNQALVLTSNTGARRLTWQLLALQGQYDRVCRPARSSPHTVRGGRPDHRVHRGTCWR